MARAAGAARDGPVVVDLAALQSPTSRGRGIGRYAMSWALALERARPDLVGSYLLDPGQPPPGEAEELLATGKVAYADRAAGTSARARVLHSLSPLDLALAQATVWPEGAYRAGLLRSATVYDLIPALDPERELADPVVRRRYRTRLELVRGLDQLHVLSAAVGRDLERLAGVLPSDVVLAGAAPSERFVPPASRQAAGEVARAAVVGLQGRFVLCPSGSHPRKNNERLIDAFAELPGELRDTHQLVIACELPGPTAHHYRWLASSLGIDDRVLVSGYVSDATMLALYQGAELVCLPSLAEGYGLPIIEALACETPTIGADRPPFDELLRAEARFDPTSVPAITGAIARALADAGHRRALLERRGAALTSWAEVAGRTAAAFDELLARPAGAGRTRRPARPRRPRLALVTPLPPAPSGVAAYSHRLASALVASGRVTVDLFADGPTGRRVAPDGVETYSVHSLLDVERLRGRYDGVCYTLGNSHHHLGALAMLRRRRGVVLAHDVRLTNLYRHEAGDPGLLPGGLVRAVRRLYGDALPASLGAGGQLSAEELERYGLLLAREAVAASEAFLVSSGAAAALARTDAGGDLAGRVRVLPFAVAAPGAGPSPFDEEGASTPAPPSAAPWWGRGPDGLDAGPLVAHFGIVDPVKLPGLLVEACAALRPSLPGLRVAFVGPIAAALAQELSERSAELGISDALILTGPLGPRPYRAWLERATVAVQLRARFNGEASAALGECLACGVPTITSRSGWARELPDDALVKVPPATGAAELARVVADLVGDPSRRGSLAAAARREAAARSFDASAEALVEIVLGTRASRG